MTLYSASVVFGGMSKGQEKPQCNPPKPQGEPQRLCFMPQGWSFDIGGSLHLDLIFNSSYLFRKHRRLSGQDHVSSAQFFFGQARSYYNIGPLSSSVNSTSFQESYSEFVGGYCITAMPNWTITPYAGLGFDFLFDDRTGYASIAPIDLKYTVYYAIAGFETHYAWQNWKLGLQFDCLPTFNQYLKIGGLSGAAWTLKNRVGAEVQVPFAYRYARNYWLEFAPYYRFFPFGTSSVLKLPERDLSQWGAFVTFRFFL